MDAKKLLNTPCTRENFLAEQEWQRGHKVGAFYVGDRHYVKIKATTGECWLTLASTCFRGTNLVKLVRDRFDAEGRRVKLKV